MNFRNLYALIGSAVLLSALTTLACNVPVFRYALDHWTADRYQAHIVHHGPLTADAQAALDALQSSIEAQHTNLSVKILDISSNPPDAQPRLILHYPPALGIAQPIWQCELNESRVQSLLHSPLRKSLMEKLSAGQSAVWLLVKSGDDAQDTSALQTIEKELRLLQATLELPKLTDDPEDKVVGGPALRVEFSLLTLDRQDKQEQELVQMLVNSEADLKELKEPILFAAFGRGRVLWPLVGAGITSENIKEMATFVTGACSCQVKEQNPGFDLLLTTDWDQLLPWTQSQLAPLLGTEPQTAELVPIPRGSQTKSEDRPLTNKRTYRESVTTPASSSNIFFGVVIVVAMALCLPALPRLHHSR